MTQTSEVQSDCWEVPVPFSDRTLPCFPSWALPDALRDFIEAEAQATQTPVDLSAMLGLSVCAATVATKAAVQVKDGYREPLNLFTVTALPSGNRKSAVFGDMTAPLVEFERSEMERRGPIVAEALSRRRVLEAKLAQAEKTAANASPELRAAREREAAMVARGLAEFTTPAFPRFIVDDCSPERLSSLLCEQDGRIAALAPEGSPFDLMEGRYSKNGMPNFDVYLKGHAGDPLRVDRIGRPSEHVASPALTMGLAVQPEVIRNLASKPGFRERGLLARFLYSMPESTLGHRDVDASPVPVGVLARYQSLILALLTLSSDYDEKGRARPHVLRLEPAARAGLRGLEARLEPRLGEHGDLGHMADWAGKLAGAVARIAGILHMVEHVGESAPWREPVGAETVESAIEIGQYLIEHARAAFEEMGADPAVGRARYLLGHIQRRGIASFSEREAFQWTKTRFQRMAVLRSALGILDEHGFIRRRPGDNRSGAGRPTSPIHDVNPLWLAQNPQNPQNLGQQVDCEDSEDCGPPPLTSPGGGGA